MRASSADGTVTSAPAPQRPARYRQLRLCSGRGAYEALPDRGVSLDLGRIRLELERQGVRVLDASVLLLVSMEVEVTISRAGRVLFKTPDEDAARRAFERLRPLVEAAIGRPAGGGSG